MAAAASMDPHDRRLSVCKSSSFKISKSSSAPRPSSATSSRPPATFVSADLSNFRRVVQELTGTPPPSASSSPLHDSSRSSRLQRIAPPRLRSFLPPPHHHQPLHHQSEPQHHQPASDLLPVQQPHHHHHHRDMRQDVRAQDNDRPLQPDFSWLASVELFSPPLPSTQVSNLNQNGSNLNGCINPSLQLSPNPLQLSPHLFSALTSSDSMWANRFMRATPSPRPVSNSAGLLPPLLPLPSGGGGDLEGGSGLGESKAFEWSALSIPSSNQSPLSPPLPSGRRLLPSPHAMRLPSPNGQPLPLCSSNGQALVGSPYDGILQHLSSPSLSNEQVAAHSPWMKGQPLLPLSPSTNFFNHWLPPNWPPSPFLPLQLPFSPSLGLPPSPGLGPFISSPGVFSFCGTNDHQSKLP